MKQKILAKLKALHPGLSTAFLEFIAAQMEAKVTEESQIEGQIQALEAILPIQQQATFFNSEADRRVTEALKKKDPPVETPAPIVPASVVTPAPTDDTPAWAKPIIEANKIMAEKLANLEAGNAAKSHSAKLLELLKAKEVPETYYGVAVDGRTFKDDAEVEAFANGLVTKWSAFQQEQADKGLSVQPRPVFGTPAGGDNDVSPMMKEHIEEKKKAAAASAGK